MVTQYQPRAMIFILAWQNLIFLISHCFILLFKLEFLNKKSYLPFTCITHLCMWRMYTIIQNIFLWVIKNMINYSNADCRIIKIIKNFDNFWCFEKINQYFLAKIYKSTHHCIYFYVGGGCLYSIKLMILEPHKLIYNIQR